MVKPSVLTHPGWFLAGFDAQRAEFTFLPTERSRLHNTAFHDGRTALHISAERIGVSLDEALGWLAAGHQSREPFRIIAHTSFCGSTLLARALDLPGELMSYREPQALIDLANTKAAGHPLTRQSQGWRSILTVTFRQFQKSWGSRETPLLKPANWANTILPDITSLDVPARIILMSMPLEDYLIANIRGGQARLQFSLNLLNHLVAADPSAEQDIQAVKALTATPLARVLCFLALVHHLQHKTFDALEQKSGPDRTYRLAKQSLLEDPGTTLKHIAETLALETPPGQLKRNFKRALRQNPKSDQQTKFTATHEQITNSKIKADFATDIQYAIDFYNRNYKHT